MTPPPRPLVSRAAAAPGLPLLSQRLQVDRFGSGRLAEACAQAALLLLWVVAASVSTGLLTAPVELDPVSDGYRVSREWWV